jgi:hypothetical protein
LIADGRPVRHAHPDLVVGAHLAGVIQRPTRTQALQGEHVDGGGDAQLHHLHRAEQRLEVQVRLLVAEAR